MAGAKKKSKVKTKRTKKPAPKSSNKKPSSKKAPPKKSHARKRDYKAEYARRIKRATAKGKTRQQARGHKPREHVTRKEHEILKRGLTRDQDRQVEEFMLRFNPSGFKDIPTAHDLLDFIKKRGWLAFRQYRKIWDAARRQYVKELRNKSWESRGLQYLLSLTGWAEVYPEGDEKWLYYH